MSNKSLDDFIEVLMKLENLSTFFVNNLVLDENKIDLDVFYKWIALLRRLGKLEVF